MYLSRFGVKNYKCLGEIDIPLTPIHVLIGENDAGKTSLLEAMAAFCASSTVELKRAFPAPWNGRELVYDGSPEAAVELWAEWTASEDETLPVSHPSVRYGFSADFSSGGGECSVRNRWLALAEEPGSLSPPIALTPKARGAESGRNKEVREAWRQVVFHQLRTPAKYALNPKLMALPTAEHLQENFSMAPDGYGLPTLLSDLAGAHPEQFIEIGNRFCGFFPQYTSVRLRPEKALLRALSGGIHREASRVGKGITFQTRSGQTVRAQQASDGAILFLGFLTLAHLPDPPNVLLIEEPENGIYPKRLGEVIKLLKELMNRTEGVRFPQIIMTTQSPYVLSHFRPEEVTFLSRPPEEPDGPVRARPLRDAPNINERLADGFYLGEVWYNISEEELFGEP